jgi:3-oxoadipate enol-lactonase
MKIALNGIEIAYEDVGTGPPVVLLHGFALSREMWRPQVAALAAEHRVVAPDLRGFGESGGTPARLDDLAADVRALVTHLQLPPFVLGGFSLGGYVLFRYLARYGNGIEGLMLLDTRAEADTAEGKARRAAAIARIATEGPDGFLDEFLRQMITPGTLAARPEIVAEARRIVSAASAKALAAALQAMADRPDSFPLLPKIAVPVLIVVGEADQLTPPDSARRMQAAISGSTLAIIPDAGHLSNLEQPGRFNAAMLEYLRGLR